MLICEYEDIYKAIPEIKGIELLQALSEELGIKNKKLLGIFKEESVMLYIL